MEATYNPNVFAVGSIQDAKNIILTPEVDLTTEQRWEKETPYLLNLIDKNVNMYSGVPVLDFGGGIGRMSKAVIDKYGCQATVLDISMQMRALGHIYVDSPNFFSVSHENALMNRLFEGHFGLVMAIWSLQHVRDLDTELEAIDYLMQDGAKLFVVNERCRFVPTDAGWIDDQADIFIALQRRFKTDIIDTMDSDVVSEPVSKRTFWGVFSKKP
jgi:ubiquinone/menaquinone biosynthesis C-methylase UbiE